MEPIVWLFLIVIGIGVLAACALGFVAVLAGWWFLIPIIGIFVGGWLGFFFGLGLVVIIWIVLCAINK